jgi:hypothetical protein
MPKEMRNSRAQWQIGWSDIAHSCREYYESSGFNEAYDRSTFYGGGARGHYLAARSPLGTVRLDHL